MTMREWTASWIWGGGAESPRNEWRCFRHTFECPAQPNHLAQLHICADSRYVLFVNGKQVGRGPVRSWPSEQFYDSYDIGHLLRAGNENTIAVLVLHFGVSNFYYIRGQGGLIAEIEVNGSLLAITDESWKTEKLASQHSNSPRMSCQQGFAEIIDARLGDDRWIETGFEDAAWSNALSIGRAGTGPWKKLIPRDIPFLTEEKFYPSSILSVHRVKAPRLMAALDLRNQMVPESANHANPIGYCGYLATVVHLERTGIITFGFPGGARTDDFLVDGKRVELWTGEQPERYYEIHLEEGDHLILVDVTSGDHGGSFHIGADSAIPFTLRSPLEGSGGTNPTFVTVGPFDHSEYIDHQQGREMRTDHPDYIGLKETSSVEQLLAYRHWIRPVDSGLYSEADVFGSSVWRTFVERQGVEPSLHNAILPVPEPALLPVFADADCELVIDLGKERTGYVGFEIDAPAGTVVDGYGVEYMRDGYTQHTYGLDNTFRYVCKEGRQSYLSPVRRGFRYLILTIRGNASQVKLHEVYINQSTYPVSEIGQFRCSDSLLNEVWEISRHTTRLCMEDTFVDCPSYEQVFWVGDSRNEALVNYFTFGATDIIKRCLNLVPGSGDITPLYLDQVPSAWSSVIPNWTFFWIIACEEYVAHTGDVRFAKDIWPAVRHTLNHYLLHLDDSGLLFIKSWNLLDWAPIDQPGDGIVTHQNLFLVKTLRQALKLAESAGVEEEAIAFGVQADSLSDAINALLWDQNRQAYFDCIHADGRWSEIFSMQTQVVAYLCDVATAERKSIMEEYLIKPPAKFVQIGSPFMSFFYYEALVKSGKYGLMLDDIRKVYGMMLEYGATTCWEMYPNFAENRANPNQLTRSHCHAWSAAPGYFLGASILGVKRLDSGWRSVEIAPQPSDLTWANGVVPLPQGGHIGVGWRLEGNRMKLRIEAPEDVRISIRLPEGIEGQVEQVTYVRE
jgi:alpha-L-rhamnosidase